jgi:hypothetical protein
MDMWRSSEMNVVYYVYIQICLAARAGDGGGGIVGQPYGVEEK